MKHHSKSARAGVAGRSRAVATSPRPGRLAIAGLAASAAALGGVALLAHARARRAERDHPPQGRFVDVGGVPVHYVERGQGPPIVLLHGNGAMIEDWEISGILDLAAEHHRVIVFDRPGFGHTPRPRRRIWTPSAQAALLHQALAALGVARPVVIGHSWGTLVALALALEHSDDVAGLVLLSGYYFPTLRADVPLLSPPALPIVGDVLRYTVSPLLGRALAPKLIRKVFAPAPVTAQFAKRFPVELALRPSQIRASAEDTALMIPAAANFDGRYSELEMPVAIMAGADDKIVDVDRQSRRLHEALPGSELRLIPGAGHMIHHLAPRTVVDLIREVEKRAASDVRVREAAAE